MQTKLIDEQLNKFGISTEHSGYFYLHTALVMTFKDPFCLQRITKTLYPVVGEKYGMTACAIERAMGHALKRAWESDRGDLRNYISVKPTIREFLALSADEILYRQVEIWMKEAETLKNKPKW